MLYFFKDIMLKEESCVSSNVMVLQRYYYVHLQCVCVHSDSYMMQRQMNWPGKWTRLIRIQIERWKEQHRTSPGAIFLVGCLMDARWMLDVGGWRLEDHHVECCCCLIDVEGGTHHYSPSRTFCFCKWLCCYLFFFYECLLENTQ